MGTHERSRARYASSSNGVVVVVVVVAVVNEKI